MDYHSIHGHDRASFDISSTSEIANTHRLPTLSASQVLDELRNDPSRYISTGVKGLDAVLLASEANDSQTPNRHGGIKRGQVTEIWGPPGTGKTALGIQLFANTVVEGLGAVWIDCCQEVDRQRLSAVVNTTKADKFLDGERTAVVEDPSLVHYSCLTLPHLMAIVSRPMATSTATSVALVVIDSITALINSALPKPVTATKQKNTKGASQSAKRQQALQFIISALQKLAATRNCAVVVLSQCATRMQSEYGATLIPAVNATVWDQGVSTRLFLFKDWIWRNDQSVSVSVAGIQKQDGKSSPSFVERISAFTVEATGLLDAKYDAASRSIPTSNTSQPKRKLGQADLEVADSDDEDYGWADEDEAYLPAPPPQWQGSEDILLGQGVGHSDEDIGVDEGGETGDVAERRSPE